GGSAAGAGAAFGIESPHRETDAEPMIHLDTRRIVEHLKTIESLAVIPRVASTNLIARRIVAECIENELSLPQAMIIAEEQFAGMGRNSRSWSSPAGKGIYATTLLTRPTAELPLVPLTVANIVATYLRDVFSIEAFIEHVDERVSRPFDHEAVLAEWRALSVHKAGDRIASVVGERTITGTWVGIDDQGRALVRDGGELMTISAGDIVMP